MCINVEPAIAQACKEGFRIADGSYRVHALSSESFKRSNFRCQQRSRVPERITDMHRPPLRQFMPHNAATLPLGHHDRVYLFESAAGLAQWPGRQQPAVAESTRSINHRDF